MTLTSLLLSLFQEWSVPIQLVGAKGLMKIFMVRFEKFKNSDTQGSKLYILDRVPHKYLQASTAKGLINYSRDFP